MDQHRQNLASRYDRPLSRPLAASLPENLRSRHVEDGSRMKAEVQAALQHYLVDPMLEIKERPSHRFRSDLVEVGYALALPSLQKQSDRRNLNLCAESIEYLHLGSLIVDDIQDGSEVRRSGQALHRLLGTPHALGVGNWLYFYALRILGELDLNAEQHRTLYQFYTKTVELAHYGQIMDLCVKINRVPYDEVAGLSMECSRYKTGSIVMLSMVLGAIVAGADAKRIACVEDFGYELGSYLQFLNDLGNFCGSFDVEKKWEDLLAWKPSLVWAFVIENYGAAPFRALEEAVKQLPDATQLSAWTRDYDLLASAKNWAEQGFEKAIRIFCTESGMQESELVPLLKLKERIKNAYV